MIANIETEENINKFIRKNKNTRDKKRIIYFVFVIIFCNILIYFIILNKKLSKNLSLNITNRNNIIILKDEIFKRITNLERILKGKDNNNKLDYNEEEEFDENLKKKIIATQHYFCRNNDLFFDSEIENKIQHVKTSLNNISFYMYVYKENDIVSSSIIKSGAWEAESSINLINCLNFYSKKKNLSNKEITVLDLGANVGWYSFYLGYAGYDVISFEVSSINNYILKKNFCLNETINITIINKGIGQEDEKCLLHHPSVNIGNAIILCGENTNMKNKKENLIEEVRFTKLSNYIPYLSNKNLAVIKIDIEGAEGKAIKSGIELITKYHVPFLLIEFSLNYLKMQGTDPKEFLEIFEKNGYKMNTNGFFSKKYLSIDELLKLPPINLYIVYIKFLE